MSFEADLTSISFNAFAVDCTLNGEAGSVILDRNVEVLDENGNVSDRVVQATFLRSFATGSVHGQTLVYKPGEADEETFTLGRRESDDGYVVTFEVHK